MPESQDSGLRWGVVVALASLAAFAAMVLLMLGWLEAALILGLASLIGPAIAQVVESEDSAS